MSTQRYRVIAPKGIFVGEDFYDINAIVNLTTAGAKYLVRDSKIAIASDQAPVGELPGPSEDEVLVDIKVGNRFLSVTLTKLRAMFPSIVGPEGQEGPPGPRGLKGDRGEKGVKGDTGGITDDLANAFAAVEARVDVANTSAASAASSAAEGLASKTSAAASKISANTSEANAATSAATASAKAGDAKTSETNASNSATAAAGSASSALGSLNSFKGAWYGAQSSDPTLDPLGAAITAGGMYWNTTSHTLKIYSGSAWGAYSATAGVPTVFGRTGAVTAQAGDYTFAQIGSKPTTISGYGITDTLTNTVFGRSGAVTAQAGDYNFSQLGSKPTTLGGYGITDAVSASSLGASNGVATLDAGGKLSTSQIPASLVGAVVYHGTWDASTNTPPLASGVGTKGWYYKVSVPGTTNIDGHNTWQVGDTIIFDGTTWDAIDGADNEVQTVFGRYGAVTAQAGDYTFAQIGAKPTTIAGYGITDAIANTVFGRSGAVTAQANDYTFAQIGSKPTNLSGYGITDAVALAGNQTITGGFKFTPANLGTFTSFTVNPALGNYQFGSNAGAFTLTAPATDCAVDLLIVNAAGAGAITVSGFSIGTTGDAITTTNGSKFIMSIRRINSISTYTIKALQ
ncbi:collagen-like protein [Bradyrhizobium ottawaense]|uniref:Tail fiber protein n=1 Tax=Bradyrhizobium ottawaense TaxID=931866 RepID=A0ABY0QH64_9BRAD|nr:collagen-like protein [Bradyrhizobium ottawaense]SDK41324.1 hypothetical protein SAMN05444163_8053 [Bradyrhizobium ottawaense]